MGTNIILIFWRDLFNRICTLSALIFYVLIWLIVLIKIYPLSRELDFIFLHYNIYFGVDLVGVWHKIFLIPGTGAVFFLINSVLIYFLHNKEKFLARILAVTSAVSELGLLVATILITLLNI